MTKFLENGVPDIWATHVVPQDVPLQRRRRSIQAYVWVCDLFWHHTGSFRPEQHILALLDHEGFTREESPRRQTVCRSVVRLICGPRNRLGCRKGPRTAWHWRRAGPDQIELRGDRSAFTFLLQLVVVY